MFPVTDDFLISQPLSLPCGPCDVTEQLINGLFGGELQSGKQNSYQKNTIAKHTIAIFRYLKVTSTSLFALSYKKPHA